MSIIHTRVLQETAVRYFLEVVRRGSITEAANTLNVASSAISRQIARLEAELDTPLFERVSLMSRISTRILTDAATTVTTTLEAGTPASVAMAAAMLSRRAVSKSETSPAALI